jgi:multiple sugar transport system permease protein
MSIQHLIGENRTFQKNQQILYEFLSNRKVLIGLTILPVLLLLTFILFIPILWAIAASFYDVPAFVPDWTYIGLDNFRVTLNDNRFWLSLGRSVIFAVASVALQLVVGIAIALLIAREFKYNKLVRAICLLPYLIPTAMLGFLMTFVFQPQYGVLNHLLMTLGIISERVNWFGNADTAMAMLIGSTAWKYSIFVTIMVLARIQSIPDGYYEAARVAGANWWQTFRDITLPNLKGVIFIVVLLRGIWMFNKFDIIWVMTAGGPAGATETAPIYAYRVGFYDLEIGRAAAVSLLLFVILIIGALVYFYVLEPEEEVNVE